MPWRIRDQARCKMREDSESPDYGDNPDLFTIKLYHSGSFKDSELLCYVGGVVSYVDYCDVDEMSLLELYMMLKDLGLVGVDKIYYNRLGVNNSISVWPLESDTDALCLGQYKDSNSMVEVFVTHVGGNIDRETDVESNETQPPDLMQNQIVLYAGKGDSPQTPPTDFTRNEFADIEVSDDSDDQNSVGEDSDCSEKYVDSESELSDEDDLIFEEKVDDGVEFGGLAAGSNINIEETGPRSASSSSHTHKGNPVFKHPRKGIALPHFFVGQCFETLESFRKAVRIHSIVNGRDVVFTINNVDKVQAKCKKTHCTWVIFASRMRGENTIQVKTYCDKHKCARVQKVKHANAKLIAEIYRDKIYTDPSWPVDSMVSWINNDLKVTVSRMACYRAKYLVLGQGTMCESDEYAMLWSYAAEIVQTNPNTTVKIKCKRTTEGTRFKRFYICWGALKKGFLEGCRPVIFLDGCHLKTPAGGIVLSAVGIDGNNGVFPFAYAVVEKEKTKTWTWFLKLMLGDLGGENHGRWTVMSDKQKGLIEAVDTLMVGCEHRFCVTHLYQNFKQQFKGLHLKNLLWKAARAGRVVDFQNAMGEIKRADKDAFQWLIARPAHNWSRSHFRCFSCCDKLENNMSESFNAMILKARSKPIISMLETIRVALMKRVHIRRDKIRAYHGEYCPIIEQMMEELKKKALEYHAIWNGENQFEVESPWGSKCKVHLGESTCSCRRWELTGLPCCHAISAIYYLQLNPDAYISKWYRKETFLKSYSHFLGAMEGSDSWPQTEWPPLLPPIAQKMPGRPKLFKRRPQVGECSKQSSGQCQSKTKKGKRAAEKPVKLSRKGTMSCSICKETSHNARCCPRMPPHLPKDKAPVPRRGKDIPAAKQATAPTSDVEEGSGCNPVRPRQNKSKKHNVSTKRKSNPFEDGTSNTEQGSVEDVGVSIKATKGNKKQAKARNKSKKSDSTSSDYVDKLSDSTSSFLTSIVEECLGRDKEAACKTPTKIAKSIKGSEQLGRRVTPKRAAKEKTIHNAPEKCTQESTNIPVVKPPKARRKLEVKRNAASQGSLIAPSAMIDNPDPKHFVKTPNPQGSNSQSDQIRLSATLQEAASPKIFVPSGGIPQCKQM